MLTFFLFPFYEQLLQVLQKYLQINKIPFHHSFLRNRSRPDICFSLTSVTAFLFSPVNKQFIRLYFFRHLLPPSVMERLLSPLLF